tara:strand:- start:169 stop:927 length:759 start_codon:yes stop_codon:yes gene_type:complete
MRVGIVGSSYSVGRHHNFKTGTSDLALPFETWLDKHTDGMQFFNAACAGKGTELYLNKVVYLKDQYDIDILLIEIVNNRSMVYVKCLPENYKSIISEIYMSQLEKDVYRSSRSSYSYWRALIQDMEEVTFSPNKKKFEIWKEIQWNIAATDYAMEFWGMLDIYQTIKLCNMLGIKCVLWEKSWDFIELPSFRNMLQGSKFVEFPGHNNAHKYYVGKYGLENILCDHDHFNDKVNDEMVRDFIGPALMEVKNG